MALRDALTRAVRVLGARSPVYGLIFLFKWDPSTKSRAPVAQNSDHIYFMKQVGRVRVCVRACARARLFVFSEQLDLAPQVITNACATQAIASILMNSADVELGPMLSEFKAFTADFPPDMKGARRRRRRRRRSAVADDEDDRFGAEQLRVGAHGTQQLCTTGASASRNVPGCVGVV